MLVSKQPEFTEQITFLKSRDLEATARFYEEVVGLPLKLDQVTCRIYQVSEDAYLGFCQQKDAAEVNPQAIIVTLVSEDVDGWYARLGAQGVTFEKPPAVNPDYQIYHCFFRDPDGYLIEIQRFLHPF